jgi:hypothetical protein
MRHLWRDRQPHTRTAWQQSTVSSDCVTIDFPRGSFRVLSFDGLKTHESCTCVMLVHLSTRLPHLPSDRGKQVLQRAKVRGVRPPCTKASDPSALAVLQLSPSSSIRARQPAAGSRLRSVLGRCWLRGLRHGICPVEDCNHHDACRDFRRWNCDHGK